MGGQFWSFLSRSIYCQVLQCKMRDGDAEVARLTEKYRRRMAVSGSEMLTERTAKDWHLEVGGVDVPLDKV